MAQLALLAGKVFTAVKTASFGTLLSTGGSIVSGIGAIQAGKARAEAAEYTAKQQDAQAKAELAQSSLEAAQEGRKKRLILSRARAVAAASGGGQDLDLLSDIEEEGTQRTLMTLWEGEDRAKARRAGAAVSRFEGRQARRAGFYDGARTLLAGGASFWDKYGA